MNDNIKRSLKKARGWTLALAIWSTVAGSMYFVGLIGNLFLEVGFIVMIEALFWFVFYVVMSVIFYIYSSQLNKRSIVSKTPYISWIGVQLGNILWILLLHVVEIRLVINIIGPVVYSSVTSVLAVVPIMHLKCKKRNLV